MAYRVKKEFEKYRTAVTTIDGRRVALNEAFEFETKPTPQKPPETIRVPVATQNDLKAMFERGDPAIEKTDGKEVAFFDHVAENPFEGVTDEILDEHGIKHKAKAKKDEQ